MNTPTPQATLPSDNGNSLKAMSLLDYFETQFVPSRASRTKAYIIGSRRAQHLFRHFVGDYLVNEINQEILDTYKERLVEAGYSKTTAEGQCTHLRAVVRTVCPEAIPDRRLLPGNGVAGAAARWTDDKVLSIVFKKQFATQQLADRREFEKRKYTAAIGLFGEFLERPARLCDLTNESLAKLQAWLSDSQRSTGSIETIHEHLLTLGRWCEEKRLVDKGPNEKPADKGSLSKLLGRLGLGGNGKQTPPRIKLTKGGCHDNS